MRVIHERVKQDSVGAPKNVCIVVTVPDVADQLRLALPTIDVLHLNSHQHPRNSPQGKKYDFIVFPWETTRHLIKECFVLKSEMYKHLHKHWSRHLIEGGEIVIAKGKT